MRHDVITNGLSSIAFLLSEVDTEETCVKTRLAALNEKGFLDSKA
jgi:hypothetical protein